ncbi:hypothetical protein CABS01_09154 [Colletotrichum abscissum]|uniref:Uncharacterized protein n=1 Tax=Colletotrichum abscissum TaxID=1671311 RepID=A0A9P9X5P7_9PEZI|nr:uncharacterized protein CABS01_09154 [Colletotrichum abscissum]KAI3537488.1 hypothetical protein CABS02_12149 [Colletotrichum abscissum]KAK1503765.1 hypothetical protein CABS01_09154 [Colletotrichum abscissum]
MLLDIPRGQTIRDIVRQWHMAPLMDEVMRPPGGQSPPEVSSPSWQHPMLAEYHTSTAASDDGQKRCAGHGQGDMRMWTTSRQAIKGIPACLSLVDEGRVGGEGTTEESGKAVHTR